MVWDIMALRIAPRRIGRSSALLLSIRGKSDFKHDQKFKIGVIADLDAERSKTGKKFEWQSYLKTGYLKIDKKGKFKVKLSDHVGVLKSNLSCKGRGMELSELCRFNGKLYACDDSTGVVFQIVDHQPIPWVILPDGDGLQKRPFKGEWMTRKDGCMYVGSTGKEFTDDDGNVVDNHRLFVKRITPEGCVTHIDWTEIYMAVRAKAGISFPGYMIHEAVEWSSVKQKWLFLPRRMSNESYDDNLDERRATNVLITASEDFSDISVIRVGELNLCRGFSSFKFIPGTDDNIAIGLKTMEVDDDIATYVTVFDVNTGEVILPDQWIDSSKYEGIEFLDY